MAEINISNLGGGGGTLSLTTTGTGGASTYVAGVLNIPVYQSQLTNPVTGTGTATRVAFWDSASSVSSSANLYWDNSNSFLGVGTATPGARLQINGSGLLTATAFAVKDSGGTDSFTVADNGNASVRGVLTISGSSASNSATLMGRTSTGEVTSVTLGTNLSFSGNTLNVTGGTGITSLNGLTAATQTFATGTTGTDFNISSATPTHTFNLPTASATNRGALSSADWSTFNGKIGGSGTVNRVPYFSATSTLTSSGNLSWDNTNNILTGGYYLSVGNSSATNSAFILANSQADAFPSKNLIIKPSSGNNTITMGIRPSGTSTDAAGINIADTEAAGIGTNLMIIGRGNATLPSTGVYYIGNIVAQLPTSNSFHLGFLVSSSSLGRFEAQRMFSSGNILMQNAGTYTDNGYKLTVNGGSSSSGALNVRGAGTTGLVALLVQNSTPSTLFQILDNGSTTLNGTLAQNGTVTMSDGSNIAVGSTNGTKIGTATTQKIGFYNKTPIVRPDTGVAEAAFVESAGTAVNDNSTFGGYTLQQVVQALQNLGLLA